jgi:hypothetical protein
MLLDEVAINVQCALIFRWMLDWVVAELLTCMSQLWLNKLYLKARIGNH